MATSGKKCPTPKKTRYSSPKTAIRQALERSGESGRGMRYYWCECGYAHITSKKSKAYTPVSTK